MLHLDSLTPNIEAARALAIGYASSDEGWEKTWEKHGISAGKRAMKGNQICVRGQTNYPHSPIDLLRVLQDMVPLDDVIKQHDFLARLSPSVVIDHVFLDTPWPTTPRDGLNVTFIDVLEDGTVSQISFGHAMDTVCPPIPGYIRSELTITGFVLKPDGKGGCNATYMLQVLYYGTVLP
jgi:hypothetical protein